MLPAELILDLYGPRADLPMPARPVAGTGCSLIEVAEPLDRGASTPQLVEGGPRLGERRLVAGRSLRRLGIELGRPALYPLGDGPKHRVPGLVYRLLKRGQRPAQYSELGGGLPLMLVERRLVQFGARKRSRDGLLLILGLGSSHGRLGVLDAPEQLRVAVGYLLEALLRLPYALGRSGRQPELGDDAEP
jgi:hypothetical protein